MLKERPWMSPFVFPACQVGSIPTHQQTASYAFLSSLQRRGGYKVLWPQLVPTGCRDPGGVCSSLSWGARVQLLDAQPKHWQVLAEEVRPGKNGLDKGLKLGTKVLWCHRWTRVILSIQSEFSQRKTSGQAMFLKVVVPATQVL